MKEFQLISYIKEERTYHTDKQLVRNLENVHIKNQSPNTSSI